MIDASPLAIYSYYATDSMVYNSNHYINFRKMEIDIRDFLSCLFKLL